MKNCFYYLLKLLQNIAQYKRAATTVSLLQIVEAGMTE
jgi:hypothetical protein